MLRWLALKLQRPRTSSSNRPFSRLERDQDIKSKDHRLNVLKGKFEDASGKLKDSTEK
jgi:hypothetical protein